MRVLQQPVARSSQGFFFPDILASLGDMLKCRRYVRTEMQTHEPNGFLSRAPTAKKIFHTQLVSLGLHHEWSGDGHDKLNAIGFPIWAVRDVFSGKWLGM